MPLIKSASNKARQRNVEEMVAAGHALKQSLAAAYRIQRKAKGKR
jgi:hypothetical protein